MLSTRYFNQETGIVYGNHAATGKPVESAPKKMTCTELEAELAHYCGTEKWYRCSPMIEFAQGVPYCYTDGIKAMANKAGAFT